MESAGFKKDWCLVCGFSHTDRLMLGRGKKYCFPNFVLNFELFLNASGKMLSSAARTLLVLIAVLVYRTVFGFKPCKNCGKTRWVYFYVQKGSYKGLDEEKGLFNQMYRSISVDIFYFAATSLPNFKEYKQRLN